MEGILKVTPEKLIASSDEFAEAASTMRSLTQEMIDLINGLQGVWVGEAQSAYSTKFNSLQTDMDKLYRMVVEHSGDLSEMAASYIQAETSNLERGGSLASSVVV